MRRSSDCFTPSVAGKARNRPDVSIFLIESETEKEEGGACGLFSYVIVGSLWKNWPVLEFHLIADWPARRIRVTLFRGISLGGQGREVDGKQALWRLSFDSFDERREIE